MQKFQAVEIRLPALDGKMPFAEFDFSFFNRTRFAGLENDAANAYCNALLQVGPSSCVQCHGLSCTPSFAGF